MRDWPARNDFLQQKNAPERLMNVDRAVWEETMERNRRIAIWAGSAALLLAVAAVARADYRVEKSLKLAPGGQFVLESDAGGVSVTGSSQQGARIVITANRDDIKHLFTFSFDEIPGGVRVTARKKETLHWIRNLSLHFEVRLPVETRLDIHTGGGGIEASGTKGDAELRTSGGGVRLSNLTGNALVRTSGGSIQAEHLTGTLDAHTSGGPIRLDTVGAVRVDTSGRSIDINGVHNHVVAKTSGGSISVTFDRGNTSGGELETSGGSIQVKLDPSVNLNIDASASGGGVTSSLPITLVGHISGSSLHGTLGKGGETLSLHTSGGSIRIEPL
jgi:hypothetical protein